MISRQEVLPKDLPEGREESVLQFNVQDEQFIRSAYLKYFALLLHNSSLALEVNT